MRELCRFLSIRSRFGFSPSTACSRKELQTSVNNRIDCRILKAKTGRKTFNSKFPLAPAIPIVRSFPMTWEQTIVTASHWVGFILPGMMELPGSFFGSSSSPIPDLGPLANQRMSLAILNSEPATTFKAPDNSTTLSWAPKASNLFGADTKGKSVSPAIFSATSSPYPSTELIPVPTAVPPMANS